MRRIGNYTAALAALTLVAFTASATAANVADSFDGVLPTESAMSDTEVGQACWSTASCGDDCGAGCCDSCDDGCCGDGCCDSVGDCGSSCGSLCGSSCCSPLENCGLLGKGILTYDPCGRGCPLPEKLLGGFACKSEACFDDFISPMTNPVYFEDPRSVTEIRLIYINHNVPNAAGGGTVKGFAPQIRVRLNDKWSIIATKAGYAASSNAVIQDGWVDANFGVKYALHRDARKQQLVSAGLTYMAPWGNPRTQQARGDGEINLFLTGGTKVGCNGHFLSSVGGTLPIDTDANSSWMFWSNHYDYQFRKGWYGLAELNWFYWTDGGDNGLGLTGLEGGDLFNFGSAGAEGGIVTGALGVKYKPNRKTEIGLAWEKPLTDREDVMESRFTADMIFRY